MCRYNILTQWPNNRISFLHMQSIQSQDWLISSQQESNKNLFKFEIFAVLHARTQSRREKGCGEIRPPQLFAISDHPPENQEIKNCPESLS